MRSNDYILDLISGYQTIYDSEDAYVSSLLLDQLTDGQNLFDRKNFVGHITASGLVLNAAQDKLLLIDHKFLKMWLQPGGHIEDDGPLFEEAMREVSEETALKAFKLHEWHVNNKSLDIPFSIDSHDIPNSIKKNEDAHVHHDFTYLFVGDCAQMLINQIYEVADAKWFNLKDISGIKTDIHKFITRIEKYINH